MTPPKLSFAAFFETGMESFPIQTHLTATALADWRSHQNKENTWR